MYGLFVAEERLLAVLDDGAAGNDADEGILVIHHRNKILVGCPLDQLLH